MLVVEAGPQVKLTKVPELYSNRVSTITAGSKKLLEGINLAQVVKCSLNNIDLGKKCQKAS